MMAGRIEDMRAWMTRRQRSDEVGQNKNLGGSTFRASTHFKFDGNDDEGRGCVGGN
jgi:hypothetical protein